MGDELLTVRVGQLIDGNSETPFQSCALTHELEKVLVLLIPYVRGESQFDHTVDWFEKDQQPISLLFWDQEGMVTMTDLRSVGHAGAKASVGRLAPRIAIFGRPRSLKSVYKLKHVLSRIDGLQQFTQYRSVHYDHNVTQPNQILVNIKAVESVRWRYGGFTYEIRATAPWHGRPGKNFTAESDAVLQTKTHKGATIDDHIRAQWPIRALLVLSFGSPLYWREHHACDDQFPTWTVGGPPRSPSPVLVRFQRTVGDFQRPEADRQSLSSPMFRLSDLGSRGLKRWCSLYEDPVVRRAIEPAVEVINGASRFLEPKVMMTVMALEAMGHYHDSQRSRNQRLAHHIKRCIAATNADWSSIGSEEGIAIAIANTYNDLKHPDRPNRPSGLQLRLITDLAIAIMRMQLFALLALPFSLRQQFYRSNSFYNLLESFRLNGVTINADGTIVRSAD